MDLNRLYFDHQLLLMRADGAQSDDAQHQHQLDATLLAGRIGGLLRGIGAGAAPAWEARGTPLKESWLSAPFPLHQDYAW